MVTSGSPSIGNKIRQQFQKQFLFLKGPSFTTIHTDQNFGKHTEMNLSETARAGEKYSEKVVTSELKIE